MDLSERLWTLPDKGGQPVQPWKSWPWARWKWPGMRKAELGMRELERYGLRSGVQETL